jgi:TnpA family transposase
MPKLKILTPAEQLIFNNPPHLSPQEQIKYFELPPGLVTWLDSINNTTHRVGFILLWAYCQKSMRFYQPRRFHGEDVKAVCLKYNLDADSIRLKDYNKRTFNYHKQVVRQYIKIKPFDPEAKVFFLACIKERVARHYLPKQILEDVFELLQARKIEIPGYSRFALTITKAISDYDKHLVQTIEINLSSDQKTILDELLQVDQAGFSKIASLKNISHSKKPKKIKESMLDFQLIGEIYRSITSLLGPLNMHSDTIKHYATWVRKASLFQITQLQANKRYLYLICFIIHQYQLRQDIFADILLSSVQSTQNSITKNQKEQAFIQRDQQIETLQLLSASRISQKGLVKKIDQITNLPDLSDTQKVNQIKELIEEYYHQSATYPPEPQLDALAQQTLEAMDRHNYYRTVEDFSLKLQNRVADILRNIEFDGTDYENPPEILLAIQHYQSKVGNVGKESPINFLTSQEQNELYTPASKFRVSLYKAFLYFHTADAIKAGVISLKPSYRYLSLENYLHPKAHWLVNKYQLLEEAGLLAFADVDQLLKLLRSQLNTGYHTTNRHIKSGKNLYVKFARNKMILATPKVEKLNTQPVSALFADQKYTSILKVLSDTQRLTNYLDCFRHHHVKDKKVLPQTSIFYAAILGLGCNIGVNKMANVSKGITEDGLTSFVNWYMNIDNINEANKRVLHLSGQLELAKIYQKNPQELHTSSDGRRVHVGVESLNANQSFKYFGNKAGSSLYSFIDELNRVFYATFISSSEREAAYVADGLLHNLSIKSSIHSTDTHGYSEAVFAVLHMLGIYFAPRIKNLQKATLYSFESRKLYEAKGYKILPDRYINADLIKKYWDDILRLMITIKLKVTTTSQIFKRLSSYSRQHPLYCAIKEFGRIIKSLFILRYMDQLDLRQAVEKQLSRIELSNKFSKAILFGNNQEIQYSGKEEQEIVVASQRLIQNAIVLWNELFLSQKLATTQDEEKRKALLTIIRNGSTLVWDYVNLHGEYDFTQDIDQLEMSFDIHKILAFRLI